MLNSVPQGLSATQLSDPQEIVNAFKQAEQAELVGLREVRVILVIIVIIITILILRVIIIILAIIIMLAIIIILVIITIQVRARNLEANNSREEATARLDCELCG